MDLLAESSLIRTVVINKTTEEDTKTISNDERTFLNSSSKLITSQMPKIAITVNTIIIPTRTYPAILRTLFITYQF